MATVRSSIRAARGTQLRAKSWLTEAPLRMLENNLDPEVAENPDELIVYGGSGKAARNWECFDTIVETLKRLNGQRDASRPVGQAGRSVRDAPERAASADLEFDARARVGDLATSSAGSRGSA